MSCLMLHHAMIFYSALKMLWHQFGGGPSLCASVHKVRSIKKWLSIFNVVELARSGP